MDIDPLLAELEKRLRDTFARDASQTEKGKIRVDVPLNQHFECIVTFNGNPMPISYGFDTSGSGG